MVSFDTMGVKTDFEHNMGLKDAPINNKVNDHNCSISGKGDMTYNLMSTSTKNFHQAECSVILLTFIYLFHQGQYTTLSRNLLTLLRLGIGEKKEEEKT